MKCKICGEQKEKTYMRIYKSGSSSGICKECEDGRYKIKSLKEDYNMVEKIRQTDFIRNVRKDIYPTFQCVCGLTITVDYTEYPIRKNVRVYKICSCNKVHHVTKLLKGQNK